MQWWKLSGGHSAELSTVEMADCFAGRTIVETTFNAWPGKGETRFQRGMMDPLFVDRGQQRREDADSMNGVRSVAYRQSVQAPSAETRAGTPVRAAVRSTSHCIRNDTWVNARTCCSTNPCPKMRAPCVVLPRYTADSADDPDTNQASSQPAQIASSRGARPATPTLIEPLFLSIRFVLRQPGRTE